MDEELTNQNQLENKYRDEFRKQKHDFILEYYKMAITDLDRHMKIGWDTIATLSGFVIALSLGFEGKLPIIIAIIAGISILGWGVVNIIDNNYWSIRAIGFLANVEAIYFTESDRKRFNPYIGYHPYYKILPELRNHFYLIISFLIIAIIFSLTYSPKLIEMLKTMSFFQLVYVSLPLLFVLGFIYLGFWRFERRAKNYLDFTTGSPGPGIVQDDESLRSIDFNLILDKSKIIDGDTLQRNNISTLKNKIKEIRRNRILFLWLSISFYAIVLLFFIFKNSILC